jgi:hypothetical protein
MNKFVRILLFAALLLGVMAYFSADSALAVGKFPEYTAGVQVANLTSSTAETVTLTCYTEDGSTAGTDSASIPGNDSKTFFPLGCNPGFSGAVVVSADQEIAAIANVLSANFSAGASYVGRSSGAETVNLPLLNKNNSGFDTYFAVQNAGGAPANIEIDYSDGTSNSKSNVSPNAAAVFDQSAETHNAAVFAGSASAPGGDLVAAVIQESSSIMFAYTGFTSSSTNPFFPLVNANNSGYITGIQIQNTGDQASSVTVSYTPSSAGAACTETQSINAGDSKTFALGAFANGSNSNCAAGAKFIGSGSVTNNSANQSLVAIVNQLLPGTNGEAYSAFAPSEGSSTIVMPLIMDRNNGYFTGIAVVNVGGSSTTATCTFSNSSYTVSKTLSPGESLSDIQNNKIADKYVGSATCTASGGGSIVGIVNQLGPNGALDQLYVYEAVNVN